MLVLWLLFFSTSMVGATGTDPSTREGDRDSRGHSSDIDYRDPLPRYRFEYGVRDEVTGDHKSHYEQRDGDFVQGHYELVEPGGRTLRSVHYSSSGDDGGFVATVVRTATDGSSDSTQHALEEEAKHSAVCEERNGNHWLAECESRGSETPSSSGPEFTPKLKTVLAGKTVQHVKKAYGGNGAYYHEHGERIIKQGGHPSQLASNDETYYDDLNHANATNSQWETDIKFNDYDDRYIYSREKSGYNSNEDKYKQTFTRGKTTHGGRDNSGEQNRYEGKPGKYAQSYGYGGLEYVNPVGEEGKTHKDRGKRTKQQDETYHGDPKSVVSEPNYNRETTALHGSGKGSGGTNYEDEDSEESAEGYGQDSEESRGYYEQDSEQSKEYFDDYNGDYGGDRNGPRNEYDGEYSGGTKEYDGEYSAGTKEYGGEYNGGTNEYDGEYSGETKEYDGEYSAGTKEYDGKYSVGTKEYDVEYSGGSKGYNGEYSSGGTKGHNGKYSGRTKEYDERQTKRDNGKYSKGTEVQYGEYRGETKKSALKFSGKTNDYDGIKVVSEHKKEAYVGNNRGKTNVNGVKYIKQTKNIRGTNENGYTTQSDHKEKYPHEYKDGISDLQMLKLSNNHNGLGLDVVKPVTEVVDEPAIRQVKQSENFTSSNTAQSKRTRKGRWRQKTVDIDGGHGAYRKRAYSNSGKTRYSDWNRQSLINALYSKSTDSSATLVSGRSFDSKTQTKRESQARPKVEERKREKETIPSPFEDGQEPAWTSKTYWGYHR